MLVVSYPLVFHWSIENWSFNFLASCPSRYTIMYSTFPQSSYPIVNFVQSLNYLHLSPMFTPVGNNHFVSATHSGSFFGWLFLVCFPAVTRDQFSPGNSQAVEKGSNPFALIKFLSLLCLLLFLWTLLGFMFIMISLQSHKNYIWFRKHACFRLL